MSAADRWREALAGWAIPPELLAGVDESPYRWPVELFRRRHASAEEADPSPTLELVSRLAGAGGSVLDIGAGTGRASLPLAVGGHSVVGVEKSADMAKALREEVRAAGVDYTVVETAWPGELDLGRFDVVMAAHVVYDVPEIVPFLAAMSSHAARAVVLELTESHPWVPLAPYYRALHGLERPEGPTVDDLAAVVGGLLGRPPTVERWERPGGAWFESWDEIEELYGRRLVVPAERRHEVRRLLAPDVAEAGGRMTVGPPVRRMATLWWSVPD